METVTEEIGRHRARAAEVSELEEEAQVAEHPKTQEAVMMLLMSEAVLDNADQVDAGQEHLAEQGALAVQAAQGVRAVLEAREELTAGEGTDHGTRTTPFEDRWCLA